MHHWWLYGSKWPSRPSLEKEIKYTRNLKFSQPPATRCKKTIYPPQRKYLESKSSFLFETCIHYFHTWSFQVPSEKNHHLLKCQFSTKIPIWPMFLLYKPSEKWLNPPSQRGRWGWGLKTINYLKHHIPSTILWYLTT